MYRLIPFKSIDDVENWQGYNPEGIYESIITNRGKALIQDTKDMVVEEVTTEELIDYQEKYDISFCAFNFEEEDDCWKYYFSEEYFDIHSERFLNDEIGVTCFSVNDYYERFYPSLYYEKDSDAYTCYGCCITYKDCKLSLDVTVKDDSDFGIIVINGVPVYFLNNICMEDDFRELYFDVMQFNKTDTGFNLIIYLEENYFGVELDSSLKPIRFSGLDYYEAEKVSDDYINQVAKERLLGRR